MKAEYDFSKGERGRFYRGSVELRFPTSDQKSPWIGPTGKLSKFIDEEVEKTLDSYRAQPGLVTEHANLEHDTIHGGYADRQLFELVQSSADALLNSAMGKSILIRLTKDFLYCADDGIPIDEDGIEGLMFAHTWHKRNTDAIGRFGLGFKSVLGVSDAPEFYSRPGSFRFGRSRTAERISKAVQAERYPVLRLPEPIDPEVEKNTDEELQELMNWANNIVRLPLKADAHAHVARQIQDFPPEFLLFVDHVNYLTLEHGKISREFILRKRQGELHLSMEKGTTRWRCFKTIHCLSEKAQSDRPIGDESNEISIWWAAPIERLTDPGQFWAFFPTKTMSLAAGILNARWKTNEDRQILLRGPYNDELIKSAAKMMAEELPGLATKNDPARHLDALPRRQESGDSEQSVLLRYHLMNFLRERKVVPDQNGNLQLIENISYPPKELSNLSDRTPFERWALYSNRPCDWLHHKVLTRKRLASIDRLFPTAPRATIADWLGVLVQDQEAEDAVQASMAAVQTAATIPVQMRSNEALGEIVLTASDDWRSPDPECVFLLDELQDKYIYLSKESYVHPDLMFDCDTVSALKNLGLKSPSIERKFKHLADRILNPQHSQEFDRDLHIEFWKLSRELQLEVVRTVIRAYKTPYGLEKWPFKLRVQTLSGQWRLFHSVLLPGGIVPEDGSRDDVVTVDLNFHKSDEKLLRILEVTEKP